jgi:hypothetical protein
MRPIRVGFFPVARFGFGRFGISIRLAPDFFQDFTHPWIVFGKLIAGEGIEIVG